jgi:3-oxoacyl-[acyl-carrier protein] reductase
MSKLTGKVALVTGGASGIGKAITLLFAQEGAKVAVVDRHLEPAKAVVAALAARGQTGFAVRADIGEEEQVQAAFDSVVAALGGIDILVNCAGTDVVAPVTDMPKALWDEMLRVHMTGTFLCSRYVLPGMRKKKWGRIINLSSQLAHKGAAMMVPYCAAKAGVMGFTRALAYEAIGDGITVNCLNPGPIDTPLLQSVGAEWIDAKVAELPIKRLGKVEEIAPVALLLASDEGAYFVGASLNINGGDYMI